METATRSSKGRTALTVAGAIVLVLGALVIAAGGAALWQTGKSDGGYISSGVHRFDTTSHAIVTAGLRSTATFPAGSSGALVSPRPPPTASRCSSASPASVTSTRISPT